MRKNMFEPVGASDITFHLHERPDLQPVIDDIEGGGIYTTVPELLKTYLRVLQGRLLRPATLEFMFKPHLESRRNLEDPEDHCLANRNAIYNAVPGDIPVDYGLSRLINTVDVPGRRSQYSLSWSGLPNCYWWVDIKKGVAGVYLSQLPPTGDQRVVDLLAEFEKSVYAELE